MLSLVSTYYPYPNNSSKSQRGMMEQNYKLVTLQFQNIWDDQNQLDPKKPAKILSATHVAKPITPIVT